MSRQSYYEKGNFTIVTNMSEIMLLSEVGLKVYLALCKFADDNGGCWPSIPTLSEFTMLSESGTKKGLKEVREKGFVEVTKRNRPNGSNASNYYNLLIVVTRQVGVTGVTQGGSQAEPPLTIPIELSLLRKGAEAPITKKETKIIPLMKEIYDVFRFYSLVVENNTQVPKMCGKLLETHGEVIATAYLVRLIERDLREERKHSEFVPQLRNWRDVVGKSSQIIDYYTRTNHLNSSVTIENQDEMVRRRMDS